MGLNHTADPPALGPLVTFAEALDAGLSRDQIRQRVRGGHWESIGRGRYLRLSSVQALTSWELANRLAALKAISAATVRPDAVVGFRSAALVHGLSTLGTPATAADLIIDPGSPRGSRASIRWRSCLLSPADFAPAGQVDSDLRGPTARVRVTTPTRTWFDIARSEQLASTLVIGDSALRRASATPAGLADVIEQNADIRGASRARSALPLLDPLRETALESVSFARFVTWELPLPQMQRVIYDERGFVARVDFLWPEFRLVGEADGALKYIDRGVLVAEKRREDRLRSAGYQVVRWTWDDVIRDTRTLHRRLLAGMHT